MVTYSPVNGWPIYDSDDKLDISQALGELAEAVDDVLLGVGPTALRGALAPPVAGRVWFATDRKVLEVFDGRIWREAERTSVRQTADIAITDVEEPKILPGVSYPVFAGGTYYIDGQVGEECTDGDDQIFQWIVPDGSTGSWTAPHFSAEVAPITEPLVHFENQRAVVRFTGYVRVVETGTIQLTAAKGAGTGTLYIYAFPTSFGITRID
jgi:hypothetical protein